MSSGPLRRLRLPTGMPGLLLAVLALISQIALGSAVLPGRAAAQEQSVAALSILCGASTPAAPGPVRHHAPDCTLCQLCVTLAVPGAILTIVAALPPPSSVLIGQVTLPPPARGPPSQARIAPPPRGPPALT